MEGEAELLERARTGDRQALERLLEHYQPQVYRFARQMCRQDQDAEGVLQDTMLAMVRSVDGFKGESSTSTWLYSIARNACIKRRRKGKYEPDGFDSIEQPGLNLITPDQSPEDSAAGRQLEQILRDAIARLEPKYREVLVLRDVEQLKADEVAEVIGITVPAVKSRLHRARAMVRDAVAGEIARRDASCPDVADLYSRYLEQELSSSACEEMEAHLDGCPACTDTCASLKHVLGICRTVPSQQVPKHVQKAVRTQLSNFLSAG